MSNRSLPSVYNGCKFRSRLEARWAYYFDLIGLPWEYEPEGYELKTGCYVPDFYCPTCCPFYVEVKPTREEWVLIVPTLLEFAVAIKREVFCVVGTPTVDPQWCAYPDGHGSGPCRAHGCFCNYAFTQKSWGEPYYNEDPVDFLDEEYWIFAR